MNWTLESLTGAIHQWGRERGIHQNGNLVSQSQKLIEEAQETLKAAPLTATDIAAHKAFIDGIGDTFVVLVQLCAIAGVDLEYCVKAAYQEIRDRKGYLNEDGVFVKESK